MTRVSCRTPSTNHEMVTLNVVAEKNFTTSQWAPNVSAKSVGQAVR